MFGQCCQEASGRPAFLVGLSGKRSPHQFYGRPPQLSEEQHDAGGVARIGRSHAASTSWTVLSSSAKPTSNGCRCPVGVAETLGETRVRNGLFPGGRRIRTTFPRENGYSVALWSPLLYLYLENCWYSAE